MKQSFVENPHMEYRALPHGGERISTIGLGMASIYQEGTAEVARALDIALEGGINYFDICPSEFSPLFVYGRAFESCRDQVFLQMHFGALYDQGPRHQYSWTLSRPRIEAQFEEELAALKTDYTDFGFIHCIDEMADFDRMLSEGTWDLLQRLKTQGIVRHLGASTHSLPIARRFLATGLVDMMMVSTNPAYDYTDFSAYGKGEVDDRTAFYRECAAAGVGLSVMKVFAGGQLLDGNLSPLGQALTKNQLIQYALDRPSVMTVLPGVRNATDVKELLTFNTATAQERDYSIAGSLMPKAQGAGCVYCNHCSPCTEGIDVGLVNKYYDLARNGDDLAAQHYRNLSKTAADCSACGHCDERCPFDVHQSDRMQEITDYFES